MIKKFLNFRIKITQIHQYFQESLRLFYWTYFKPFTLQKWLDVLESNLTITTPFIALIKLPISQNDSLKNYLSQLLLLLIFPPFLTGLISWLIFWLNNESFNWLWNGFFLSSWLLGLLISYKWLNRGIATVLIISFSFSFILLINFPYIQDIQDEIKSNLIPVIEGMIAGSLSLIVANLPLTVFFGVGVTFASQLSEMILNNYLISEQTMMNFGVIIGAVSGLGLGLNWMLDFGIESGIKKGFFWGIASGVALGITSDLSWGLLWSLSFIGGIIRVYFWLPEIIYIWLMSIVNQIKSLSLSRLLLPFYLDELEILPLPKTISTITNSYQKNPESIREIVLYLVNYTNREHLVSKSLNQITLICLSRCQNIADMVTIPEQLTVVSQLTNSSELSTTLANFAKVSQAVKGFQGTPSVDFQLEILNAASLLLEQLIVYLNQRKTDFSFACIAIIKKWLTILENKQKEID
jgi:hypothetical protein